MMRDNDEELKHQIEAIEKMKQWHKVEQAAQRVVKNYPETLKSLAKGPNDPELS